MHHRASHPVAHLILTPSQDVIHRLAHQWRCLHAQKRLTDAIHTSNKTYARIHMLQAGIFTSPQFILFVSLLLHKTLEWHAQNIYSTESTPDTGVVLLHATTCIVRKTLSIARGLVTLTTETEHYTSQQCHNMTMLCIPAHG